MGIGDRHQIQPEALFRLSIFCIRRSSIMVILLTAQEVYLSLDAKNKNKAYRKFISINEQM
ncbi:MAG: hypothetical protein AAFQ23_02350 [Cyanobacteria bacterium J06623_1]